MSSTSTTSEAIQNNAKKIAAELQKIKYAHDNRIKVLAQQFVSQCFAAYLELPLKNPEADINILNDLFDKKCNARTQTIKDLFEIAVRSILQKHHETIYNVINNTKHVTHYNKEKALNTLCTAYKRDKISNKEIPTLQPSLEKTALTFSALDYAKSIVATNKLVKEYADNKQLSRNTTVWEKISLFINALFNPSIKVFSERAIVARSKVSMFAATQQKISQEVAAMKENNLKRACTA